MSDRLAQQLERLPVLLGNHLLLTVVALGIGIAISIPLAILAVRARALRGPLLAGAGVIQTVPSLALLALMVPLLGMIGFVPALIALILYSILPVLRNTVTGILGVDPALTEAARGMGMTDRQMLTKVQLPLAAPVIIAGIRTAAVWVVGIATLSTPVGQQSLGNFIFQGLQTQNQVAVLVGCAAAAGLAVVLDGLIRLMQVSAERRSRTLGVVAGVLLLGVLAGGLAPLARPRPDTFVGSKTFTEQYILSEAMAARLQRAGFRVRQTRGMGSSILFDSLANGSVDCYVDYTGTIWTNVMKRTDAPASGAAALDAVTDHLRDAYGITCVGPLGFENAYALAMPRDKAEQLGIKTIADLAAHAPRMKVGGDYEFFGRPEWRAVQEAYGLRFDGRVALDSALMYSAVREGEVDAIVAFSSDGRILAYDLVVLEDPRAAFPPYDAVLLVSPDAGGRDGFVAALEPLVGAVSDDRMRRANKAVDLDGRTPADAARDLLADVPVRTPG
jgi:osmoprotectant transport system permease protein